MCGDGGSGFRGFSVLFFSDQAHDHDVYHTSICISVYIHIRMVLLILVWFEVSFALAYCY